MSYRYFLATKKIAFNENNEYKIESRIKNIDSILYKVENYIHNDKTKGKKSINKCFNDLFGIRIILNEYFEFDDMINIVNKISKDLDINIKCIDSSKKEYKAVHAYFKIDNYNFPWELQIWRLEDEENNKNSHSKYKQEYREWVDKLKGGNINA